MEPLTLSLMVAAAGKVVNSLFGDPARQLVATMVGGIIGNRADRLVCDATRSSWLFFKNLRTENPALNHDLERGTREAYLLATLELLRQAEHRSAISSRSTALLSAGETDAIARIRAGAEQDLRRIDDVLPAPLTDAHLFLVDPALAPAARLARLRATLRTNLEADLGRWLPDQPAPAIIATLLEEGWTIETPVHAAAPRDWYSLIALAFVEKLKTTPRLATVFEAKMLAQIAAREPAAAPIATLGGFTTELDAIAAPLQRIEAAVGVIRRDVGEIRTDVKDIKETLAPIRRVPSFVWVSAAVVIVAGAAGLATETVPRAACAVPGIRTVCGWVGVGGVPTAAELTQWTTRPAGDCAAVRRYLEQHPAGAFSPDAQALLARRVEESVETWSPSERRQIFTVRSSPEPLATDAAAREEATRRGQGEAAAACSAYGGGEFRLRGARVLPETWRCSTRADGTRCGFDGTLVCEVEARRVDVREACR